MTEPGGLLRAEIPSQAELRDMLQEMVEKDLLGPVGDDEEELDDARVSDRYLVGALAPANKWVEPEQQDLLAESEPGDTQDGEPDEPQYGTPSLFPSSFGLTFTVDGAVEATYDRGELGQVRSGQERDAPDRQGQSQDGLEAQADAALVAALAASSRVRSGRSLSTMSSRTSISAASCAVWAMTGW